MNNLKLYINNKDVDNYLLLHKNDERFKYKEALFLKYLADTDNKTFEKAEMYLAKSNDKLGFYEKFNVRNLFSFKKYLDLVNEGRFIDINDICLMLVPALGLNSLYVGDIKIGLRYINNFSYLLDIDTVSLVKDAVYKLRRYSKEYDNNLDKYELDLDIKRIGVFNDTLGNYARLRHIGIIDYTGDDFSLIGKERCEKELEEYANIYGDKPVEIIKDYVKELKKKYD